MATEAGTDPMANQGNCCLPSLLRSSIANNVRGSRMNDDAVLQIKRKFWYNDCRNSDTCMQ
jgi:hypothetical protein